MPVLPTGTVAKRHSKPTQQFFKNVNFLARYFHEYNRLCPCFPIGTVAKRHRKPTQQFFKNANSLAMFASTTRNTGTCICLPEVFAWLFNALKPHFDGYISAELFSKCCSRAIHKATKLTTLASRNLGSLQVPLPNQE